MAPAAGTARTSRFYRRGNEWFCRTSLPSDIVVEVDEVLFHLHKFPLLSKCGKIVQMEQSQHENGDIHHLSGCPGSSDAFYLAVQFCYGITVEFTPKNILMLYSVATYLEMTEELEEDNLIAKSEHFIHRVILRSWKDCIIALQSAERSIANAETLPVVSKCLSALSMMVCTDISLFGWPMMMYGTLQSPGGSILWNGINTGARIRSSSASNWWCEDISHLGIQMFKKLIERMKERGVRAENIAGALMYYARKYLPGLDRWHIDKSRGSLASLSLSPAVVDQKTVLENIEMLLPEKKGVSYCRFLLGLLRVATILNVSETCKNSLERKIGLQLELATLDGLLIPSFSDSDTLYDTDCVERIIKYFSNSLESSIEAFSPSSSDPALSPSSNSLSRVSKLIDSYLAEVAPDVNLKPGKMYSLLMALPESLRSLDDGLYRALDIYFKAHPWLSEDDRDHLCSTINYGRLSIDACAHASQNERLPLRVVLQVLFFEQLQLRAAVANYLQAAESDGETPTATSANDQILQRDGWVSLVQQNRFLKVDMEHMRSRVRGLENEFMSIKQEMTKTRKSQSSVVSASRKSKNRTAEITGSTEDSRKSKNLTAEITGSTERAPGESD